MPEATAAAVPPLEPAVERIGFHGFRVKPFAAVSVNGQMPNSGIRVLPTMTAPAARRRLTTSLSTACRCRERRPAVTGGQSGHVVLVLDGDRDAVERTERLPAGADGVPLLRLGQGCVRDDRRECIELRVQPLDAGERVLDQFPGGHLAGGHPSALIDDGTEDEILNCHGFSLMRHDCLTCLTPLSVTVMTPVDDRVSRRKSFICLPQAGRPVTMTPWDAIQPRQRFR
jgi:hypothetical protein